MRCLVTGVAGFVGSHLAERLIQLGHEVIGIDRLSDYYPRAIKEANLGALRQQSKFSLNVLDLARDDLHPYLKSCDVVFHQAAQAGVRSSFGESFDDYLHDNVLSTQRLLEAATQHKNVQKVVYASSSSVYGDTDDLPMRETSSTQPRSPYGVTKLAAEHLCELYRHNFGLPTVSLRYFTVYGPRQRPDMGFNKFIATILKGQPILVYGDGTQTRDFTFVSDIVQANLEAMQHDVTGVFNIGGGSRITLNDVLSTLDDLAGPIRLEHHPPQPGDVRHTWADIEKARGQLNYAPKVQFKEGIAAQLAWQRTNQ